MKHLDIRSLDAKTQELLTGILNTPVALLTEDQKSIIRSRVAYLTESELRAFDLVLHPIKSAKTPVVEVVEEVEIATDSFESVTGEEPAVEEVVEETPKKKGK